MPFFFSWAWGPPPPPLPPHPNPAYCFLGIFIYAQVASATADVFIRNAFFMNFVLELFQFPEILKLEMFLVREWVCRKFDLVLIFIENGRNGVPECTIPLPLPLPLPPLPTHPPASRTPPTQPPSLPRLPLPRLRGGAGRDGRGERRAMGATVRVDHNWLWLWLKPICDSIKINRRREENRGFAKTHAVREDSAMTGAFSLRWLLSV